MNFADLRFWELLIGTLGLLLVVRRLAIRTEKHQAIYDRVALVFLGLVLLAAVSWKTCLIFLSVSLITYFGVAAVLRWAPQRRNLGLAVLVPLQVAPLLYYKYADFLVNDVLGQHWDALHGLIIPVGISFYTFQKIAFAVDTLKLGKPLPGMLDFLNFAGFFPQIVAGPIERREELLPQIEKFRFRWVPADIDAGFSWIVLGLFFKRCLADNIALFFLPNSVDNAWSIWAANIVFGFQIYYDFAGYSLIALGVARCLGVRLTLNFASPYCSRSATEFWRRWHITLSQWLRDYVYIPLGGNRGRFWMANLALVFVVSGIWHGAGWNFILWGALHALFLCIHRLIGRADRPAALGWAVTMLAVFFAWLSFYETNSGRLAQKLATLFRPSAYSWEMLIAFQKQWQSGQQFTLACIGAMILAALFLEWRSLAVRQEPYAELLRTRVLAILIVLTVLLAPGQQSAFIYFVF